MRSMYRIVHRPDAATEVPVISAHARERSRVSIRANIMRFVGSIFGNTITGRRPADGPSEGTLQNDAQFRAMADMVPAMIWMMSSDKLHVYFNRAWLHFTGRSLDEDPGHEWIAGIHADHREKYLAAIAQAFEKRRSFRMEYRLRRADGQYRWVLDIGEPRFDKDGAFCGLIGYCMDISDHWGTEPELQAFGGRLITAQEEERSRIARELHDNLSQQLALLSLETEQITQHASSSDPEIKAALHKILNRVRDVSADVHRLSHELHPSKLDRLGLAAALMSLCREVSRKQSVQLKCIIKKMPDSLPRDVSLCVYRVIQESISNIVKHSGACMASVELIGSDTELLLTISDAGVGFNPESIRQKNALGLISMQERLRLVGATFSIESQPLHGTRIRAVIPLVVTVPESAATYR